MITDNDNQLCWSHWGNCFSAFVPSYSWLTLTCVYSQLQVQSPGSSQPAGALLKGLFPAMEPAVLTPVETVRGNKPVHWPTSNNFRKHIETWQILPKSANVSWSHLLCSELDCAMWCFQGDHCQRRTCIRHPPPRCIVVQCWLKHHNAPLRGAEFMGRKPCEKSHTQTICAASFIIGAFDRRPQAMT